MKIRSLPLLLFIAFIVAVLQLLSAAVGWTLSVFVGLSTSAAVMLPDLVHDETVGSRWAIPATLLLASLAGVSGRLVGEEWWWITGPMASSAVSLLIDRIRLRSRSRCGLCNRILSRQLAFECPRCSMAVCDRACWSFEHLRCRLCLENEVPVFPPDARWWDQQFGPRFSDGQCQLCMSEAAESDLRCCRHCGRPQCRHCWDMMNGHCSRCQWVVAELPSVLTDYVSMGGPQARLT